MLWSDRAIGSVKQYGVQVKERKELYTVGFCKFEKRPLNTECDSYVFKDFEFKNSNVEKQRFHTPGETASIGATVPLTGAPVQVGGAGSVPACRHIGARRKVVLGHFLQGAKFYLEYRTYSI